MATRGSQGGLSGAARKTIDLIDASGKDIILIETTGVGQAEVSIAEVADTVVVMMVPGYGDDIQLMKTGQIEISNIIVINKANRDGAEDLANGIREIFSLCPAKPLPPIIMAQATNDVGIEELYSEIEKRRKVPKPR
jgi:LAO/AO transport system kinase